MYYYRSNLYSNVLHCSEFLIKMINYFETINLDWMDAVDTKISKAKSFFFF